MNKIYRTVYNETTNTWVAVEETAKSHRKSSSGVVDNATAGVSGSLKVRSLTAIAAALALVSPFMANQAQAALCQNNTTKILVKRDTTCQTGETTITTQESDWGGGSATGLNSTAWGVGTANGTNSTAWNSGYAGAADSTYEATIKVNNPNHKNYDGRNVVLRPFVNGSVTYGKTTSGFSATAWGTGSNANFSGRTGPAVALGVGSTAWSGGYAIGDNSTAFGAGAYAAGGNSTAWVEGKAIGASSTAWGRAFATGSNATAWGNSQVLASGNNSTAFGNQTHATASQSVAWGRLAQATSNQATAWGNGTAATARQATAFGENTQANSRNSVAWGSGSVVAGKTLTIGNTTYTGFKLMEYADSTQKSNNTQKQYYIIGIAENGTEDVVVGRADDEIIKVVSGGTEYAADDTTTMGGMAFDNMENSGGKYYDWLDKLTGNDAQNSTAFGAGSKVYAQNALGALGGIVGEKGQTYGKNSAAIGEKATVLSDNAIALGKNATVYTHADNSLAALGGRVGGSTTDGEYSQNAVAIGFGAVADYASSGSSGVGTATTPSGNVALGVNTHAEGAGTVAIGGQTGSNGAYAQNSGSIAIGAKAEAVGATLNYRSGTTQPDKGTNSEYDRALNTANWGINTKPSQMVAIGDSAAAYGDQATAIGANTIAAGTASIAMGGDDLGRSDKPGKTQFANIQTQLSTLNSTLTANGYTAPSTLTNTLTAGSVAYYDVTLAQGDASVVIGQKAVAEGHLSNAVGALSRSKGNNSIAFGTASQTGADNSIAMGAVATTGDSATQSTAIGYMAQTGGTVDVSKVDSVANMTYSVNGGDTKNVTDLNSQTGTGENSVAVGEHNKVLGSNSTAVGQGNIVIGNNSGAFGDPNVIIGDNSKVVGNDNVVAANKAFVVGNNVTQTADNSVFLGDSAAYVAKGTTTAGISQYTDSYTIGNAIYDNAFAAKGSGTMGVVSVGAVGSERRIQNVAAGLVSADSTDAINGSQLNAAYEDLQWRISAAKTGGDINTAIDSEVVGKYTGSKNGGNVKFIAGDGVKITTSRDATTDGSLNLEFSMNTTTVSNTDNGSLKLDDITKSNSPATAASVVNAVNNSYWVATDGTNSANVKPSNQVNWVGANGVKVGLNTTTNTFTAELDNTYLPEVAAGTNIKSVDKSTGNNGQDIYTVNAVGVKHADGNQYVKVTGGGTDDFVIDDSAITTALNSTGFTLKSSASDGEVSNTGLENGDEITNGESVTIDAGKNIKVTQSANGNISVATKDDVSFNNLTVTGDTIVNNLTATGETKLGNKFTVANDGTVTYSNSNPTNANEVVNKTYADNLGWDLQVNGVKQGDTITNGKAVNFANGSNTTVEFADNAVKVNVNTTTLTTTGGKVNNPTSGGDNLTTAQNVADMINQSYWIAQDGNDTGTDGEQISAGDQVVFKSQDGSVQVKRTTNSFDFAVNKGADPVVSTDGTVTDGIANTYWDSKQVSDAINNSGWVITSSTATNASDALVTSGDKVDLKAGNGVKIEQAGRDFTFSVDNSTLNAGGNKPLQFAGDTGETVSPNFGDTVNVKGNAANANNLTDGNIGVVGSASDNTLTVKLNKDLNLGDTGSLKTGDTLVNNGGITITNGNNPVMLTKDGLNNGGNKITNVVAGESPTDAVNVSQLETGLKAARTEVAAGTNIKSVDKSTGNNGQDIYTVNAVGVKHADGNQYVKVTGGGTDDFVIDDSAITTALNSTGFTLKSSASDGEVSNTGLENGDEITNGESVTIDAGKNIKVTQSANGNISVATKDDVSFNNLTVTGDTIVNNLTATGETKLGNKFTVANDGTVTYSNSNPTNANEVVNKTYADNLGWDLQVNGVKQGDTITNGKAVNFANGSNTTVEFADNAVKVNVNTTTLTTTGGKVNNPTSGGDNLTTAQNVADMINQSYWIAQDGNGKQTQVKAGDAVTWQGQGSLKVENTNGTFTISDNTTYGSNVEGLTLSKQGDQVTLGGDLTDFVNKTVKPLQFAGDSGDTLTPSHGDTVNIVGDGNISVVGENGKLNVKLNPNVDLGEQGSLKTGDTLVNNDGMTINNGSAGAPVTLTKDGLNNGGNKITNVAVGVDDTDAVNVSQLKEAVQNQTTQVNANINKIIYGEDNPTDERKKDLLKTYNADTDGVRTTNSVAEAIHNMNEYGIKFFHTNDGTANPQADSTNTDDSIAGGQYATAIGWQARANGENALAIGNGAKATGVSAISIGTGNEVSGNRSTAIGDPNTVSGSDSHVLGNTNTVTAHKTMVVGNNVTADIDNSVYLGNNTKGYKATSASTAGMDAYATNADNIMTTDGSGVAIAKGELKFAGATPAGVVSVGDVGSERRIQNVAAGLVTADSTDAINGSQLYSVAQKVGQIATGGAGIVQYSNPDNPTTPNGGVATNDVTLVGADAAAPVTIHNVAPGVHPTDAVNVGQLNQAVGDIHNRIGDVSKHADASAASAIAVASMPQAFLPGKNLVAIGGGTYHGQTGYAIGVSTISDNGHWIVKGTATGNSKNRYGAGIGAGYQW